MFWKLVLVCTMVFFVFSGSVAIWISNYQRLKDKGHPSKMAAVAGLAALLEPWIITFLCAVLFVWSSWASGGFKDLESLDEAPSQGPPPVIQCSQTGGECQ